VNHVFLLSQYYQQRRPSPSERKKSEGPTPPQKASEISEKTEEASELMNVAAYGVLE
jgi:hypothetical protein